MTQNATATAINTTAPTTAPVTTSTLHTFAANDPQARLTWGGRKYRAVRIEGTDEKTELSVWLVRVTERGTDFKATNSFVWLTLENSLERFPEGANLAAYVHQIVREGNAPTAMEVGTDSVPEKLTATIEIPLYIFAYAHDHGMTVAEALESLLSDMAGYLNNTFHRTGIEDYVHGMRTTVKAKLRDGRTLSVTDTSKYEYES